MTRRMNRVGVYLRVSTEDQTLDSQRHEIEIYLKTRPDFTKVVWYEDLGYSGAYNKRPAYQRMLADAESGKIGNIVVYKLDRFTRNAREAIQGVLRLDDIGCHFISITQPMFNPGATFRQAMIAIFAELAQMERDTLVERINSGIAAAKARGVVFGRPKKLTSTKEADILKLRATGLPFKKIAEAVGLSVGVVHKAVKASNGLMLDKTKHLPDIKATSNKYKEST